MHVNTDLMHLKGNAHKNNIYTLKRTHTKMQHTHTKNNILIHANIAHTIAAHACTKDSKHTQKHRLSRNKCNVHDVHIML